MLAIPTMHLCWVVPGIYFALQLETGTQYLIKRYGLVARQF